MEAKPIRVQFQRDEDGKIIAMVTERNVYVCTYELQENNEWKTWSSKAHVLYLSAIKVAWDRHVLKTILEE